MVERRQGRAGNAPLSATPDRSRGRARCPFPRRLRRAQAPRDRLWNTRAGN